jgi:hypothetical protein
VKTQLQLNKYYYYYYYIRKRFEIKQEHSSVFSLYYRGVDKSLARPGRKRATEDFDVHISYL